MVNKIPCNSTKCRQNSPQEIVPQQSGFLQDPATNVRFQELVEFQENVSRPQYDDLFQHPHVVLFEKGDNLRNN